MSKIEAPHLMAAILVLALIGIFVILRVPDMTDKIVGSITTGIVALGMKLLENHGQ